MSMIMPRCVKISCIEFVVYVFWSDNYFTSKPGSGFVVISKITGIILFSALVLSGCH